MGALHVLRSSVGVVNDAIRICDAEGVSSLTFTNVDVPSGISRFDCMKDGSAVICLAEAYRALTTALGTITSYEEEHIG